MKVGDSKPVGVVRPIRPAQRNGSYQKTAAATAVSDSASIMGIPEVELTPKVRDAIMALMSEVESLRREIQTARERIEELEHFADHDPLVPVRNRRAFVRELTRLISFADRYGMPASIVYLDLNDLKTINDTLGHAAGDAVLMHVGELLIKHVRESDIVGRLGGDEFGVILPNANEEAGRRKAETLAHAIQHSPATWEGKKLQLSVAYGLYAFTPGEDATEAMAKADRDMYERKKSMKEKSDTKAV